VEKGCCEEKRKSRNFLHLERSHDLTLIWTAPIPVLSAVRERSRHPSRRSNDSSAELAIDVGNRGTKRGTNPSDAEVAAMRRKTA
jgi:hypothetical protein